MHVKTADGMNENVNALYASIVALMEKKNSSYCGSQSAMQLSFSALHLLVMEKKVQRHLVYTSNSTKYKMR